MVECFHERNKSNTRPRLLYTWHRSHDPDGMSAVLSWEPPPGPLILPWGERERFLLGLTVCARVLKTAGRPNEPQIDAGGAQGHCWLMYPSRLNASFGKWFLRCWQGAGAFGLSPGMWMALEWDKSYQWGTGQLTLPVSASEGLHSLLIQAVFQLKIKCTQLNGQGMMLLRDYRLAFLRISVWDRNVCDNSHVKLVFYCPEMWVHCSPLSPPTSSIPIWDHVTIVCGNCVMSYSVIIINLIAPRQNQRSKPETEI